MLETAARAHRTDPGLPRYFKLHGRIPVPITVREWSRQIDLEQSEGIDPELLADSVLPTGDRITTRFNSVVNDWDERLRPLVFVTFLADGPGFPRTEVSWYSATWEGAMATHAAARAALGEGRLLASPPCEP